MLLALFIAVRLRAPAMETAMTRSATSYRPILQRRDGRLGIKGKLPRFLDCLAAQDILAQRLRQRFPAIGQARS